MRRLLRPYRWWLALAGLVLLYLLGKHVYLALLPAEAWIDRGWDAMRKRDYPLAEKCFTRAETKAPDANLPKVALWALYGKMAYEEWPSRFGIFTRLPLIGHHLESRENTWIFEQREYAAGALARREGWHAARFWRFPAARVFVSYWKACPRALPVLFDAVALIHQGQVREGWEKFRQLEDEHARAFRLLCNGEPYCVIFYGEAARRTGNYPAVERMVTSPSGSRAARTAEAQNSVRNWRMPAPSSPPTAQSWVVDGESLRTVLPSAAVKWLPPELSSMLALAPGRGGASLLYIPAWTRPEQENVPLWWDWRKGAWALREKADIAKLAHELTHERSHEIKRYYAFVKAHAAWSDTAEYLALRGDMLDGYKSALLRLDGGVRQISGVSPHEIVMCGDNLWARGDFEFTRLEADGTVIAYQGKRVTQLARVFERERRLPSLPVALDQQWRLAADGRGRLWLVSWDGGAVVPRVVWEGETFRAATGGEVDAAREGFVDAANRLWFTADLPEGFQRDAWREAPGLPPVTTRATYAVDAGGRVWVICGGIAARWEDGRWVSVAQFLPVFAAFDAIVAVGDGVMILAGDRVSYLE